MEGEYVTWEECMLAYKEEVLETGRLFKKLELKRLPWGENSHADPLVRLASALATQDSKAIPIEYLSKPIVVKENGRIFCAEEGITWMNLTVSFLNNGAIIYGEGHA